MSIVAVRNAVAEAEGQALTEPWVRGSRLTVATWSANKVLCTLLTIPAYIAELPWQIPRALLSLLPFFNLAYLVPVQLGYLIVLGAVYGSSWLWRRAPLIRALILPVGLAFATVGRVYVQLLLIGGPGEHGANKLYKSALFDSWPLTEELALRLRRAGVFGVTE